MSRNLSLFETEYEEKLYNDRVASLNKIGDLGESLGLTRAEATYPNSFPFTTTIPQLRALGEPLSAEELEATPHTASIAGRLLAHRHQGKAGFAQLQQNGERIQIYVRKDDVGEPYFELYKLLHVGDHIGVRGTLMRTRTGELTLKVMSIEGLPPIAFLAKAMLALPDKYHGLEDVELRYRQRYVDLIMNSGALVKDTAAPTGGVEASFSSPSETATEGASAPGALDESPRNVREVFVKRAAILRAIRKFFDTRGYLEVETPMLHVVAGGATARTFTTHHNAEDMELTLRIAPELHLKRLVVGGLDRVYEINRNFRNEGIDRTHNPEFTMLEFYQAYANYHDLMDITEKLITFVAQEVNGTTVTHFNGNEIDLGEWTKLSMREAIIKFWPPELRVQPTLDSFSSREVFFDLLQAAGQELLDNIGRPEPFFYNEKGRLFHAVLAGALAERFLGERYPGKAIATLFEGLAEPHLIQPTIIYDFPLAVSPLSKVKPDEPEWVERFEFYIGGFEVGNAFSELNDAADQQGRFEAQIAAKAAGDEEAMGEVDTDYVRALGYGLPPTAGEGIGIDRLTMLLTGSRSIRDVLLFPLMRRLGGEKAQAEEAHGESAE